MGKKAIAKMLNDTKAPKNSGLNTWTVSTVSYILNNERYIGDALFQKRYTTDTLPFVEKINHGEKAQYYVENMNTPIISKPDFEAVQRLIQQSRVTEKNDITPRPLMQKILCKCYWIKLFCV